LFCAAISRIFAEKDSSRQPLFGVKRDTDAVKLFTRQQNATVYHRLLHETTTLNCELDAVKIRHDQLMTKLDRNKISFKSAVSGVRPRKLGIAHAATSLLFL
jgi:hypothetical protein